MTYKQVTAIVFATGVFCTTPGSVMAASGVNVGVLKCTVDGGIGMIFGSSKGMKCRFTPGDGGPVGVYKGTVNKVGLDIGVTEKSHITWVVVAPGKVRPDALAGTYLGVTGQATIGVGLGANVLVGGFKKGINLQPISVQAQTGLNVAGGIGSLRLRYAGK